MNSDWIARGIAKDLQREINKLIEKIFYLMKNGKKNIKKYIMFNLMHQCLEVQKINLINAKEKELKIKHLKINTKKR